MSRKIDALIAKHVMGWKEVSDGWVDELGRDELMYKDISWIEVPHYSTDIAAAWEVVEKMSEDKPFWISSCKERSDYTAGYFMYEWEDEDSSKASTAPMAICLAALKAKGIKHE